MYLFHCSEAKWMKGQYYLCTLIRILVVYVCYVISISTFPMWLSLKEVTSFDIDSRGAFLYLLLLLLTFTFILQSTMILCIVECEVGSSSSYYSYDFNRKWAQLSFSFFLPCESILNLSLLYTVVVYIFYSWESCFLPPTVIMSVSGEKQNFLMAHCTTLTPSLLWSLPLADVVVLLIILFIVHCRRNMGRGGTQKSFLFSFRLSVNNHSPSSSFSSSVLCAFCVFGLPFERGNMFQLRIFVVLMQCSCVKEKEGEKASKIWESYFRAFIHYADLSPFSPCALQWSLLLLYILLYFVIMMVCGGEGDVDVVILPFVCI